jgi:hypothetical protein
MKTKEQIEEEAKALVALLEALVAPLENDDDEAISRVAISRALSALNWVLDDTETFQSPSQVARGYVSF